MILILAALAFAGPAHAQAPNPVAPNGPAVAPPNAGTQLLLERLSSGATLENFLNLVRSDFRNLDANSDDKLTPTDTEIHGVMQQASNRFIYAMMIFRADLDGDGVVTTEELERLLKYDRRNLIAGATGTSEQRRNLQEQFDNQLRQLMLADTDKDGRITFAEAIEHGKRQIPPAAVANAGFAERVRRALTLDPDKQNAVSRAQFESAAEALFRTVDTDGDGRVSQAELVEFRNKPQTPGADAQRLASDAAERRRAQEQEAAQCRAAAEAKAREGCEMPRASKRAKVILLSNYETDAISTTTIGSQDMVLHAGKVVVEPGDEPLYLVITTYSATIWQFSGALDRIERIVVSSLQSKPNGSDPQMPPAVGVTGLPKDKVIFLKRPNCVGYFSEAPSRQAAAAAAWVRQSAGREPEIVSADYSVQTFYVPSGKREKARDSDRDGRLVIQKDSGTLHIIGDSSNVIAQSGPRNLLRLHS